MEGIECFPEALIVDAQAVTKGNACEGLRR